MLPFVISFFQSCLSNGKFVLVGLGWADCRPPITRVAFHNISRYSTGFNGNLQLEYILSDIYIHIDIYKYI